MNRLPMTVIAGYLGAGKTTLINRLLAGDHGMKLLIMVNDFGAINIDADLLVSADEDTLTLSNGCVCCTMGADLFMALGDALDRRPRPDHLIIEASGIADPGRIANAAVAEPEMSYGGIVTVVDGSSFKALSGDALIGAQVRGQVAQADLIVVSKVPAPDPDLVDCLTGLSGASILTSGDTGNLSALLLGLPPKGPPSSTGPAHPPYLSWSYEGNTVMTRTEIESCLNSRPAGIFRLKGVVRDPFGGAWEIQVVGAGVHVSKAAPEGRTRLVAIGPAARISRAEIDKWWNRFTQSR